MKYLTSFSRVFWLCTAIFLVMGSSLSFASTNQDETINFEHQQPKAQYRTRRSTICSCSACMEHSSTNNHHTMKFPTRIPFGSPRKVLSFLRMVRRGLKITYRRRGQLYCKNGFILKITSSGNVGGTTRYNDPFTKLEFQSVGMGLVRIKGLKSGRYLAINENGTLYSKNVYSKDCIFEERQEENFYHSFSSHRYSNIGWYVALRRNGQVKKTTVLQKATQFLVLFS
ncbi:fibroblast growth factor 1 [Exaiptasia diaphana]|uniref:Fibroblast growth factor n=1 Tax=Exaiptasia diaphana TaxID=2652724 RepID=A0A913X1R4_EXADI|nr:fibroblast growth factor 1 [Exaiptasia diaphana]